MKYGSELLKTLYGALIGVTITLAVSGLYWHGITERIDSLYYDALVQIRGVQTVRSDITLITIDEPTRKALGKKLSQITRAEHAQVITNLAERGAKLIVMDIDFSSPSSPGMEEDDFKLAQALADAGNVIMARYIAAGDWVRPNKAFQTTEAEFEDGSVGEIELLIGEGAINVKEDPDGILRRMPLVVAPDASPDDAVPALALEAAIKFLYGLDAIVEYTEDEIKISSMGKELIIPHVNGDMVINYHGPRGTYPYVSFSAILNNTDKTDLSGHIVLIGNTHPLAHDEYPTPFPKAELTKDEIAAGAGITMGYTSGLEIHANTLETILDREFINVLDSDKARWAGATVVVGLIVTLLVASSGVSTGFNIIVIIIILAGMPIGSYILFSSNNIFANIIPFELTAMLVYAAGNIYQRVAEQREKRFIKGAFSMYLAPAVIDELIKDPDKLSLGGEKKVLTALFTDIQKFSAFSEKMEATQLVHFLNEYLTEMTDIVLEYGGTVDKFIGDAIVVFFGAPIELPDHAIRACKVALKIQSRSEELNKGWEKEYGNRILTRIGINTGPMVVGNMGSKSRMDYTIMGDAVNIAARIEGANKKYGTFMFATDSTVQACGDSIVFREVDTFRVVGKAEPVSVYEPIGLKGNLDPRKFKVSQAFEAAKVEYRKRKWDTAANAFQAVLEIDPNDGPAQTFLKRCRDFQQQPPQDNWDLVWTLTEK